MVGRTKINGVIQRKISMTKDRKAQRPNSEKLQGSARKTEKT